MYPGSAVMTTSGGRLEVDDRVGPSLACSPAAAGPPGNSSGTHTGLRIVGQRAGALAARDSFVITMRIIGHIERNGQPRSTDHMGR